MFHIIPRIDPRGQAYERMGLFYTGFVILFTIFIVAMTWSSELTVFGILPESAACIGAATSIAVEVCLMLLGSSHAQDQEQLHLWRKDPMGAE